VKSDCEVGIAAAAVVAVAAVAVGGDGGDSWEEGDLALED